MAKKTEQKIEVNALQLGKVRYRSDQWGIAKSSIKEGF